MNLAKIFAWGYRVGMHDSLYSERYQGYWDVMNQDYMQNNHEARVAFSRGFWRGKGD